MIDDYIARSGVDALEDQLSQLRDGFATEIVQEVDLAAADITSVIWAAGYSFDFEFVRLPLLDAQGFPSQVRGVTAHPGLYFVGLNWMHSQKSGLLQGVGEDAAHVAGHIAARCGVHIGVER
jgi:putative flavoprotein involved in K+ transport